MQYWQVFWLALAESFPLLLHNSGFVFSKRAMVVRKKTFSKHHACNGAYSYGDSAGLTPDFPF